MSKQAIRRRLAKLRAEAWSMTTDGLEALFELLQLDAGELDPVNVANRLGMRDPSRQPRSTMVGSAAVLPFVGPIRPKADFVTKYFGGTALEDFAQDFEAAMANDQVKHVYLYVDSPGGSAIGNEEVAKLVFDSRGRKPTTAFIDGIGASAGYYVPSATDRVLASPSSPVGSIGTIALHVDASKFYEDWGVKVTPITFGKHKADGNSFQPLNQQSRETLQAFVDSYGEQFVAAVARNRGVTPAEVMDRFGQGKVFLGAEAQERGLVDGLADSLADVIDADASSQPTTVAAGWAGPLSNQLALESQALEHVTNNFRLTPGWTPSEAAAYDQAAGNKANEVSQPAASAASNPFGEGIMNPRIKAALYARGLIDAIDASDEVCQIALRSYYAGIGQSYRDDLEDQAVLDALSTPRIAAVGELVETGNNAQQAHDNEVAEARQQAAADERRRAAAIRASGELLEMDEAAVNQAIESGASHETVIAGWHQEIANREPPVSTAAGETRVNVGIEGIDRLNDLGSSVVLARNGYGEPAQPMAGFEDHRGAPLMFFAREALRMSGQRIDNFANPEDLAMDWLSRDAQAMTFTSAYNDAAPANRPGRFPNLLSALANKILDQALQLADATYPAWTGRMGDAPDFKPRTIIGMGAFEELDQIADGAKAESRNMDEELTGWIQVDRFGNKAGLTPVMVANDDLDGFMRALESLSYGHEMTLNRLCVNLVADPGTQLPDGNPLYGAGNEIGSGSGGAPSNDQMDLMRQKHRAQKGIGDRGRIRTPPRIALVPTKWETPAEQAFIRMSSQAEVKNPALDTDLNVFRGSITPIVEPELDDFSAVIWYSFADPRIRRVIVHSFMQGYGRGGRRTTWWDDDTETRYVKLEGRFGAATAGRRGSVRNAGQ